MRIFILATIMLLASAVSLASEGQQGDAEQSVFSGTFADSLWTVITFILLLVVLGKFAWKPMLNGLKARQEYIKREIQTAEETRKQAEKLLEDYKQKGLKIIKEATETAQRNQQEIMEETRQETLLIRQRAIDDIRQAEENTSERLWNEAGDMLLTLGSKILEREVTKEDNERLVREAVEKIRSTRADGAE